MGMKSSDFYCKSHILGWGPNLHGWAGEKVRKSSKVPIGMMCHR